MARRSAVSKYTTGMPRASARTESWLPMFPYPMIPNVRPRISWAPLADLSQTPACRALFLAVSPRVRQIISARASSTTLRVLENGALNTAMASSVAAARSTWLVPMQNAPTAMRSVALARTDRVTRVPERMPNSCTPCRASLSSRSSSAPERVLTSMPAAWRYVVASGWTFSKRRAFTQAFHQVVRPQQAGVRVMDTVTTVEHHRAGEDLTNCGAEAGVMHCGCSGWSVQ